MEIICNKVENKRAVVEMFYLDESENWHRQVHKNGGAVQENIESTVATISEESEMYEVDFNGELAAFFVKAEDKKVVVLEGFHVMKEFRHPDFLNKFWEIVKVKMGGIFYTGVYEKNNAGLEHLKKQGFEIINSTVDNEQKVFILKLT